MRRIIYLILPIIIVGCGQNSVEETKKLNSNNPYIKVKNSDKKTTHKERILELSNKHNIKLEEIKTKKEETLAKIESIKEQKLKELELKTKTQLAKTDLQKAIIEGNKSTTIANIQAQKEIKIEEEESSFKKVSAVILGLILILFAILKYLSVLSKRRQELELKEKEQNHEAYMHDIKSKHEHISKMLDIISDEKSDKEIKKSLTKLLERGKSNILEHKK